MIAYPKINSLFKRDMTGRGSPLIQSEYATEAIECLAPLEWDWSEKIDGTNVSISGEDGKLRFYGRTSNANMPVTLVHALLDMFNDHDAVRTAVQAATSDQTSQFTLYGEGCGGKIQKSGQLRYGDVKFVLFDVLTDGVWLSDGAVTEVAAMLNVFRANMWPGNTVEEMLNIVKSGHLTTSDWNREFRPEGVVGRAPAGLLDRYGRRVMTKIKCVDFDVALKIGE